MKKAVCLLCLALTLATAAFARAADTQIACTLLAASGEVFVRGLLPAGEKTESVYTQPQNVQFHSLGTGARLERGSGRREGV